MASALVGLCQVCQATFVASCRVDVCGALRGEVRLVRFAGVFDKDCGRLGGLGFVFWSAFLHVFMPSCFQRRSNLYLYARGHRRGRLLPGSTGVGGGEAKGVPDSSDAVGSDRHLGGVRRRGSARRYGWRFANRWQIVGGDLPTVGRLLGAVSTRWQRCWSPR